MNQSNALNGDEPTITPIECNFQPLEAHFKSCTPPPNNSPVVSDIMVRLNHNAIDNDDVEFYTLNYLLEYTSESVPEPDNTPIKFIDDDEMDQLLELFY